MPKHNLYRERVKMASLDLKGCPSNEFDRYLTVLEKYIEEYRVHQEQLAALREMK